MLPEADNPTPHGEWLGTPGGAIVHVTGDRPLTDEGRDAIAELADLAIQHMQATEETPAERLERWEASGYGSSGGSAGDRVAVLREFVTAGVGCPQCPRPATCNATPSGQRPCSSEHPA